MKITGFLTMDDMGVEIAADTHGNNIAFACFSCGHPVLAIARENQRGSDEKHPADCKSCGDEYFLDVRIPRKKLYVHLL